jgi:hypothetical protein
MANEASAMKTAYHIETGPHLMYEIDANGAVVHHPDEWSSVPWSIEETNAYRQRKHENEVAKAKAAGRPEPQPPADLVLTEEQTAELDADEQARADAAEIVAEADAMERDKREWDRKVAEARALLATPLHAPAPQLAGIAPFDPKARDNVFIDDNWESFSVPKQRSLAMKLGAPNTVTAEEAKVRIANEFKRRSDPAPQAAAPLVDQHPAEKTAEKPAAAAPASTAG